MSQPRAGHRRGGKRFEPVRGRTAGLLFIPFCIVVLWAAIMAAPNRPAPTLAGGDAGASGVQVHSVENGGQGEGSQPNGAVVQSFGEVAPVTPWLTLDAESLLTRIGVGSCLHQLHPQPIWNGVLGLDKRPDVFVMAGDNVYGDVKGPDMAELIEAYRSQGAHVAFGKARAAFPFLATWDDHDYGLNDGGGEFAFRDKAARLFYDFWQLVPERPPADGIHHARIVGPPGRRVQFIMLDTRSFRSALTRKGDNTSFKHWGKYEPSTADDQQMLGAAQWAWLEAHLRQPAELRVIVSSIQVLAEGHGFERWGNLPKERERFVSLIEAAGATGVVLVSGDRHAGGIYSQELGNGLRLVEITASSLNRSYGPSKDGESPGRIGGMVHQENFGLIDIDWEKRALRVSLRGMDGAEFNGVDVSFADIGVQTGR